MSRLTSKMALLGIVVLIHPSHATQLAVLRVPDGLLVAGNEAETTVFPQGPDAYAGKACKIFSTGRTVGLIMGSAFFTYKGRTVGSLLDALRQTIAQSESLNFADKKLAVEKAFERAMLAQIEAKKNDYPSGVPPAMRVTNGNFILAMYEGKQFKTAFVSVNLDDWKNQTFSVHEWPLDLNKVNLVQWFQVTPLAYSEPVQAIPSSQERFLRERMSEVYMRTNEPYRERMRPPYVIGKLTSTGFSWVGDPDLCGSVVFKTDATR